MIAVAIFPVFYFFFLKLNLFPVLHLCSVVCSLFLPTERCQTVLLIEKCETLFFEAILSPSERYQNIQDDPQHNNVLPFRIILKVFAVNMLFLYISLHPLFHLLRLHVTSCVYNRLFSNFYTVYNFFSIKSFFLETVSQRCSVKKVFLEISKNSQESACARVCFLIKLQAKNISSYRTPPMAASVFSVEDGSYQKK